MSEPIDLDTLEALAEATTEGPWHVTEWEGNWEVCYNAPDDHDLFPGEPVAVAIEITKRPDAALITAARTALPALVSEVRNLRARLEQAEHEVEALENQHDQLSALRDQISQLADEWASWPNSHDANGPQDFASALRAIIQSDTGGTKADDDCDDMHLQMKGEA